MICPGIFQPEKKTCMMITMIAMLGIFQPEPTNTHLTDIIHLIQKHLCVRHISAQRSSNDVVNQAYCSLKSKTEPYQKTQNSDISLTFV